MVLEKSLNCLKKTYKKRFFEDKQKTKRTNNCFVKQIRH